MLLEITKNIVLNKILQTDTAWENVRFISLHSINLSRIWFVLFFFKDAEVLNLRFKLSLNVRPETSSKIKWISGMSIDVCNITEYRAFLTFCKRKTQPWTNVSYSRRNLPYYNWWMFDSWEHDLNFPIVDTAASKLVAFKNSLIL